MQIHNARPIGAISLMAMVVMMATWTANLQVLAADPSNVFQLAAGTFYPAIHNNEVVMVQFYAPWCKHCKKLAPEYEMAAERLKMLSPERVLEKVDCVAEDAFCDGQDVQAYPTLKVYRYYNKKNGRSQDYRKAGATASFLQA